MLHREDQIKVKVEIYDVVSSIPYIKRLPGRMNSYNKTVEGYKEFEGYALVLGASDSYAQLYFPNRERKLVKTSLIKVVIKSKFKEEKK